MLMRLYPFFAYASGPAEGLSLEDIKVTILKVNRADKSVETVVDAQPAQAEIGKGYYAYYFEASDLDQYDYLPFVEYVGSEPVSPTFYSGSQLDVDVHTRASLGAGAVQWTYTVTTQTGEPIPDVDLWITSDPQGKHVLASGRTNQQGQATFWLDPGTVYVWRQKSGWNFANPDEQVVG